MSWGIMFSRYDQSATKLRHKVLFALLLSSSGILTPSLLQEARAAYTESEFKNVISAREARVDDLREQEIQQLQVVLSRAAARDQDPDMLLRLAELYTEKYRLYFYKETEIWQKKMDAYLSYSVKDQKHLHRPVIDNGGSKQWIAKTVHVLERITSLHSRYEKLDEVYYYLGFNNWEAGKRKESLNYFERLIKEFPNSRYRTEAYRYVGDAAFAARDFTHAQVAYKRAAKEDSPARPRVLYGLAWSYFKTGDYDKATDTMRSAIQSAKQAGSNLEKTGLGLQRDAYDALALFYAESGTAKEASEYFSSLLGKNDAVDLLRKLAVNYQRQGKYSRALEINKQLTDLGGIAKSAGEDQRYTIMLDSIKMAANKGDRAKELALLKTLVTEFVTNEKKPDEARYEQVRTMIRHAALAAHQEGNKSSKPEAAYSRAEELYKVYLSSFGGHLRPEDIAEVHYYLADVYSQLGKYQIAAGEFRSILEASLQGDASYKKYQEQAAQGMIFSLDSHFKNQKDKALDIKDANDLMASIDRYVSLYPRNKDVPKYLARAAGILVTSKRMDEARPRLVALTDSYPSSKEALDAAILLVKDSEDRKEWQAATQLAEKLLANSSLMAQDKKGSLKGQLQAFSSRAKFKEVKSIEDNSNFGVAAQKYEQLAVDSKDKEVRYKALNNAAVNYAKAADKDNELKTYLKILQLYPDNEQAAKNILGTANDSFLLGQYSDAAKVFELYYSLFEKSLATNRAAQQKQAIEAIRSAAFLREALNDKAKASEDFKLIVVAANKNIPAARDAAEEILFDTAKRMQDAGNSIEAIRSYQKYIGAFPNGKHTIDCTLQIGVLYAKLQEDEKSLNHYNAVIARVKTKGRNASHEELGFAAHARLLLLAPLEEAFHNSSLRLPEAQLKKDIAAKLASMERLNKGYVEVVEFGDGAWAVESFRRMALVYREFGEKLESAPVPAEFSPEEQAKFRAQLKNIAQPVFMKVGETLESALRKGESLLVVGPALAKVYLLTVVQAARPDRYPLVQEVQWADPGLWIAGDVPGTEQELTAKRHALKAKSDDANAWVSVGNWHLMHGEFSLAKIFYQRSLDKSPKFVPAINNLAYLTGRNGDIQQAFAGFKTALAYDEFATGVKKNMARIHMASGLWRHANLAYRQLEVRTPNDKEVKRGLGLSYLAIGKLTSAEPLLAEFTSGDDQNAQFAKAIWKMAKGDSVAAKNEITKLAAAGNSYAALIQDNWMNKENAQ